MTSKINIVIFIITITFAQISAASKHTLKAIVPWNAEGKVFQISAIDMLFLGELEGIIYVQDGEGNFDEGFVNCPVTQKIDIKTGKTSASGHCIIVLGPEDSVFAEMDCKGVTGQCEGSVKFTGGIGMYQGIKGKGTVLVRSPIKALVTDLSSGSAVRANTGMMVLSKIQFELPKI